MNNVNSNSGWHFIYWDDIEDKNKEKENEESE